MIRWLSVLKCLINKPHPYNYAKVKKINAASTSFLNVGYAKETVLLYLILQLTKKLVFLRRGSYPSSASVVNPTIWMKVFPPVLDDTFPIFLLLKLKKGNIFKVLSGLEQ